MAHILAPAASSDLDDIWYYIARESGSIERADRQVESITERFYLLSRYPYIGRERNDLRPGLRSFTVDSYVIIYRVTEEGDVLILHVPHGRQDLQQIVGS
jgi:toxin ParE1/3/4